MKKWTLQCFNNANISPIQDGGNEQLATCRRDFRNRPYPVKLKIRYFKGKLDLFYHGGVTEFDDYEHCATVEVKIFIKILENYWKTFLHLVAFF